jgi:hypothetical protein
MSFHKWGLFIALRWTFTIAAAMLASSAILTLWWTLFFTVSWGTGEQVAVSVERGAIRVDRFVAWVGSPMQPRRVEVHARPRWRSDGPRFEWKYSMETNAWTPKSWRLCVPLWTPVTGVALPAGLLWLLRWLKRRMPHCCMNCGYDRRGLPAADTPCPECGMPPGIPRPPEPTPKPPPSGMGS